MNKSISLERNTFDGYEIVHEDELHKVYPLCENRYNHHLYDLTPEEIAIVDGR